MNLALVITLCRVGIAPLFAWFFIAGYQSNNRWFLWAAIFCAFLIELSDMVDGMTARARNEVTDFGKVFDPVADSVSRQTIFISFMVTGIIPLWLYLVFFYRDAFMQLMRIVCASRGVVVAARRSGKMKAILQAIAAFIVLFIVLTESYGLPYLPRTIYGMHPGFWVVLAAGAFSALSVIDYIIPNRSLFAEMMRKK